MGYCYPIKDEQKIKRGKSLDTKKMKKLAEIAEKSIFEVKTDFGHGTGFLCKIEYDDWSSKRVLITNNHILSKENILPGKEISFSMNNGKIKKKDIN